MNHFWELRSSIVPEAQLGFMLPVVRNHNGCREQELQTLKKITIILISFHLAQQFKIY